MSKDQSEERTLSARLGITSKQILYLLIADIGYALALNLFYVGNNIAAGGLAGIGRTHLSAIERGERKPTLETFFRIAYALDMKASALMQAVEKELENAKS